MAVSRTTSGGEGPGPASEAALEAEVGASAMAKASWRLLPLIGLAYLVAYMDRANISFAALQMNSQLGFSAAVYGLGAGVFFLAYSLFEIPSNLMCARFGPRRWIARIMLTWGLISAGMLLVRTPWQFYAMRFALGVAEAGFFPGVMLYLSAWFPNAWRGRAVSRFYIAVPIGMVVMGGLAGRLLGLGGLAHLAGWQWLFLAEGLPAVALAGVLLVALPDAPDRAAWLSAAEKAWLGRRLEGDVAASGASHGGFARALFDPLVLGVGSTLAVTFACFNAIVFSAPKLLVVATGWSVTRVGFLTAAAGVAATLVMLAVGWHSDLRRERYLHVAGLTAVSGVCAWGLAVAVTPLASAIAYLAFISASLQIGLLGFLIIADAVHPASRAVSFAALNTLYQIGSFIGPALWGVAADRTGGFHLGLQVTAAGLLAAAAALMVLRHAAINAAATRATVGDAAGLRA